jgi:DNA-binding sugar fermentation-stimulating protein
MVTVPLAETGTAVVVAAGRAEEIIAPGKAVEIKETSDNWKVTISSARAGIERNETMTIAMATRSPRRIARSGLRRSLR